MLRKALTLGVAFILALSLLLVSMVTCFTLDAEAHDQWRCKHRVTGQVCYFTTLLFWFWVQQAILPFSRRYNKLGYMELQIHEPSPYRGINSIGENQASSLC